MSDMVEVRGIVRREMLDRVVHALKEAGVPRLTVTKVHAIGAGVDPRAVQDPIKATAPSGSESPRPREVRCRFSMSGGLRGHAAPALFPRADGTGALLPDHPRHRGSPMGAPAGRTRAP